MKKILITGTGGFIGRNLAEQLSADYEVIPVSRKEADLLDQKQVEQLFRRETIDVVIHSATQGTLGRGKEYQDMLLKNNLTMFLNLERCSDFYGKMLVLGSGAEYDKRQELSLVAEEAFGESVPEDDYGLSKYLMSKIILEGRNLYNLRLFGIFGKYENYNYRLISNLICKALQGKDIVIHQNVLFDYLYMKDFCRIVPWFIEHTQKHKCYNVCTGKRQDIVSIAREVLFQTAGRGALQIEKEGFNHEYTGDNTRLLKEMGQLSFTPMQESVSEMIEYYQAASFKLEGNY